ncbi:SDR family oxidoreductase [Paenarthrobacter sp. Z7-10]|uniref:SDR family oxidoreductase n=1 Tax=Paenarthrobacter sp. Z7-10 TaxID=2787635 RepID=UPI0022A9B75F|nr:SDR family oxidoreductase [Paenarthrobacter sp. Z7-10]MCZ2403391.1 SDR family oxidoreductase [Paenarthrobacter sp. Z7-10]
MPAEHTGSPTAAKRRAEHPVEGKVAVVTGAGSGIGRAVAQAFLNDGYRVALAGRTTRTLEETAGGHPQALVVAADVTKPDDVGRLFGAAVQRWGRIDVVFNNAGIFGPAAAVDEISVGHWNNVVAVNLTGTMLCAAAAVRQMKTQSPQGGRIINNGSISAHSPRPLSVAYTTTKHAVTGLTKSIDLDGRDFGISCGQIDIGNAATGLMSEIGVGSGALQADGSRRAEPTFPVEEAAKAVLLMAQMPPSASVGTLVLTAAGMPFIGRG